MQAWDFKPIFFFHNTIDRNGEKRQKMSNWHNKSDNNNNGKDQGDTKPSTIEKHEELKNRPTRVREPFLDQLKIMLNQEAYRNNSDAIRWRENGDGFIITDQNKLQDELIPKYFPKPIIFQSFVRKLYRWGFRQIDSCNRGRYEFVSNDFTQTFNPGATSTRNDDQFLTHQVVTSLYPASFDTRFFPLNSRKPQQIFDESFSTGAPIINHDMGIASGAAAQSIANSYINRPQNQLDLAAPFEASRFSTELCDFLKIDDIHTRLWVAKLFLEKSSSLSNQNGSKQSSQQAFGHHSSKPAAVATSATSDLGLCSPSTEHISSLFRSMIENNSEEVVLAGRAGIGLQQHQELRMGNKQSQDGPQQLQSNSNQQEDFADFVKKCLQNKLCGQEKFDVPCLERYKNVLRRDQTQCPSQNAITSFARSTTLLQKSIGPNSAVMNPNQPKKQSIPARQQLNRLRTSSCIPSTIPRELLQRFQVYSCPSSYLARTQSTRCLQSLLDENSALFARSNPRRGSGSIVNMDPNLSSRIVNHLLVQGDSAHSFQHNPQFLVSGIHPQNVGIPQGIISALKHQMEGHQKRHASFNHLKQQMNPTTSFGQSFPSSSLFNSETLTIMPSESILAGNLSESSSDVCLQRRSRTWNAAFESNVDHDEDDSTKTQRRRPSS